MERESLNLALAAGAVVEARVTDSVGNVKLSLMADDHAADVAVSAIVATVTMLLMGALSERLGRRKPSIVAGYIAWALSTALFPAAAIPEAGGWPCSWSSSSTR